MSAAGIIRRDEFLTASLQLGGLDVDLADYATTGLRAVTIGPSGIGKSNAGLVIAEQLAAQGWVSVIFDPEGELASLYHAVATPELLETRLRRRDQSVLVCSIADADEFVQYGAVVMAVADAERKPIFLMIDEAQMFSASRAKKAIAEASSLVTDFAQRGRKRSLDLFLSAHRFTGSLSRAAFTNKNLSLIGRQEDPTAWPGLAPMFRGSGIGFSDLAALGPGEFFCFSRRGVEKVTMPMAAALQPVALKARRTPPSLPTNFSQWDTAVRAIPTERLRLLTGQTTAVLGAIANCSPEQMAAGRRALRFEAESRG